MDLSCNIFTHIIRVALLALEEIAPVPVSSGIEGYG